MKKVEKNNNKINTQYINKENFSITKKNPINYNLIYILLITSFLIITIQVIYIRTTSNKKPTEEIKLRNTESTEYKVDKSSSLDKNGQKIYSKYNKINFNQLENKYKGTNGQDLSKFNHTHIALCLNEEYHLLAAVTIASALANSNSDSYIHFHIIALNELKYEIMKKIYSLKSKINNNSEFIFYNGKQVEKDFEDGIKVSERGAIDYGRFLITEVINESDKIDKVISLDIGDIIIEKDLYGLYKKDLGVQGYLGVEDAYPRCFLESIFNHKEKYVNGGVLLLNVKKWKEMNLYKYFVKMFKYVLTKTKFYNPYTDIMNDFLPWRSTGYMSLKYNLQDYIVLKNNDTEKDYEIWTKDCSYYHDKKDTVVEAEREVVIRNLHKYKVYKGQGTEEMKKEWKLYAEKTGFYEEISQKYKI